MESLERFVLGGLPLGILVIALLSAPIMVFRPEGLARMRGLESELGRVRDENATLKRDIGGLRAEVKGLREDPQAVERIARDQLGLVRKSEVVFHFGRGRTAP